jgi:Glycosyl hydrolases family 38 N-terminal domain
LAIEIKSSQTNQLLFTAGDDFFFHKNGEKIFVQLEEIFNRLNAKYPNMTWKFSTPSKYIKEIESQKLVFPVKFDDFMPFGDNPEMGNYWVGYFSSRPNLKS